MRAFFTELMLLLVVGVPLISTLTTLGYLFCAAFDWINIRKMEKQGMEVSGLRQEQKKHHKSLLVSFIVCACGWVLLIVLSYMMLANM